MDEPAPDHLTLSGFVAIVVLIGLNFVAVRVSNIELAPLWGAALRYVVSALLVVLIMFARRVPFPRGRAFRSSALFGTLNFAVFFGLMYWALVAVPPGVASVVLAAVPLFTYLMALALRLEGFRWSALVGAIVVILGIGIIAMEGIEGGFPPVRFAAVLAAALAAAAAGIVVKRAPRTHPLAMNGVGMTAGALLLLVATFIAGEPRHLPTQPGPQAAVVYLILSSVLLFVLLVWVIGRWTASKVSYATVLAPIVTIIVAHLVLDDPITSRLLLGGAFVVAGVYWGALRKGRPVRSVPTA
ncbi:MAG: DMT family transporter [Euryarchaeota archaeon]|nr:DMT family transporter [Euryarchaeota archaeon]